MHNNIFQLVYTLEKQLTAFNSEVSIQLANDRFSDKLQHTSQGKTIIEFTCLQCDILHDSFTVKYYLLLTKNLVQHFKRLDKISKRQNF